MTAEAPMFHRLKLPVAPLSMLTAVRVTGTQLLRPVPTIVIVCAVEGNGENIRE